jgi:hypothetical protein
MTTYATYAPENRDLQLDKLSAADFELITSLHGEIKRGERTLICRVNGNNGEMFVRRYASDSGDIYRAVHFAGGAHGPHPIALETVEHRRQKDYWARAAADSGYAADLEVPVNGAGVMDVVISGGDVPTDIEVQHSEIHQKEVRRRTTRYYRAGYLPVWFNDAGGDRPRWLYDVPALGCNALPWDVLPPRRQVTATGLGVLRAVRCDVSVNQFNGRCPDSGGRPCGRTHPLVTAGRIGLTVDDVPGMLPAGHLVPLAYRTGVTFLVSPEDLARYEDATGGQGVWRPGGKPGAGGKRTYQQRPEPCQYPEHEAGGLEAAPVLTLARRPMEPVGRARHRTVAARNLCPGCGESELTFGRELCQTCRVLGRTPR